MREQAVDPRRARTLKAGHARPGLVLYWMSREQRARDNWALLYAQQLAVKRRAPLGVAFSLVPEFLGAAFRQYAFMLRGLEEVERDLLAKGIPFFLLRGSPGEVLPRLVKRVRAGTVVTDFNPLRIKRRWNEAVAARIDVPFHEVDAHNIVPCWAASEKQEFSARTFRPRVRRALGEFLTPIPALRRHPFPWHGKPGRTDWQRLIRNLPVDRSVPEVDWLRPGPKAAGRTLWRFLTRRLSSYGALRNDPSRQGQSDLSPYLHFGQLSAQRVALEVLQSEASPEAREAFLEELIVRRELSDNFCFHNPNYDRLEGLPDWAKRTLAAHRRDRRPFRYTCGQLETAGTHDPFWNAAQREMLLRGKMHGYMRMYWAKKILEWSASPEEAMAAAIYLNDRFELDGRDPNGYVGIAWSIGGLHDRPWKERPVFGTVRFMSAGGLQAKFNMQAYVRSVESLESG